MYPPTMPEEELKTRVAEEFFKGFDVFKKLGRVDFCVSYDNKSIFEPINFLWAEAKKGNKASIIESLVQLILTIGKERTQQDYLPPLFLGAFDCEKIALIPYYEIMSVFTQNDFNWNVAPSNYESKEFKQLYATCSALLESKKLQFNFEKDKKELHAFIASNFDITNDKVQKIPITTNNFISIYQKWRTLVAPSISIDWNLAKNAGILDADFYLADLLSSENQSLLDNLFVVLKSTHYEFNKVITLMGSEQKDTASFKDNQKAHISFWNLYERPPEEEYWGEMIDRRDLLVPSDIRERKGSFFTPKEWVEIAHHYLGKALGVRWQKQYYIWDCAAGTGNLLAKFENAENIFASTIDKADVAAMHELADSSTLSLLENHIFQFDFLNDSFFDKPCEKHKNELDSQCKDCIESKLPKKLQQILSDENERKKLVIFINPPYAEASNRKTPTGTGKNKEQVATDSMVYKKYSKGYGTATREIFSQFFIRINEEISGCKLASFSTLKYVNAQYYDKFRALFKAKFLKGFICPAYTFDNVKGNFPIGFLVWDLSKNKNAITSISVDVFDEKYQIFGKKSFCAIKKNTYIIDWLRKYYDKAGERLTFLRMQGTDFSNNRGCFLANELSKNDYTKHLFTIATQNNLIPFVVYFSVRHCIKATWLNDRDQFLAPNNQWLDDIEFQNDCLAFMLFHRQNKISCKEGINHFIPFGATEIKPKSAFSSSFMSRFIAGDIKSKEAVKEGGGSAGNKKPKQMQMGFYADFIPSKPLKFSAESQAVFKAGLALYKHYHAQARDSKEYENDAALYDIKAYFQGFDEKGKMNHPNKAQDSKYVELLEDLNAAVESLAKKIAPKVYEYGFLLE